jgi:hypothetical protein
LPGWPTSPRGGSSSISRSFLHLALREGRPVAGALEEAHNSLEGTPFLIRLRRDLGHRAAYALEGG